MNKIKQESTWSIIMGAAFLMATSAIGPGFLTQTTVFTEKLAASFGFVILVSILIDIGAQLNVWRIIAVAEKYGQDIANDVLPGMGYFVMLLVVAGGLARWGFRLYSSQYRWVVSDGMLSDCAKWRRVCAGRLLSL